MDKAEQQIISSIMEACRPCIFALQGGCASPCCKCTKLVTAESYDGNPDDVKDYFEKSVVPNKPGLEVIK